MAKSSFPKLDSTFKSATIATQQEQQIVELQAEVERLKQEGSPDLSAQVQALQHKLDQAGEQMIDLALIDRNEEQSRRTITPDMVRRRGDSLQRYGQITPLVLIARPDGRYLIEQGELRWRAAELLGWTAIRAVVDPSEMDRKEVHLKTLLDFVHREDLTPLDRAEAIVRAVTEFTEFTDEGEISTTLTRCLRRIERQGKEAVRRLARAVDAATDVQEEAVTALGIQQQPERSLILLLLDLRQHPGTFKTKLLPLLRLPTDLKEAMQQLGLETQRALMIATINAKGLHCTEEIAIQQRQQLIDHVMVQYLSREETRDAVQAIKDRFGVGKAQPRGKQVQGLIKQLEDFSWDELRIAEPEELKDLRAKLATTIEAIDETLP